MQGLEAGYEGSSKIHPGSVQVAERGAEWPGTGVRVAQAGLWAFGHCVGGSHGRLDWPDGLIHALAAEQRLDSCEEWGPRSQSGGHPSSTGRAAPAGAQISRDGSETEAGHSRGKLQGSGGQLWAMRGESQRTPRFMGLITS